MLITVMELELNAPGPNISMTLNGVTFKGVLDSVEALGAGTPEAQALDGLGLDGLGLDGLGKAKGSHSMSCTFQMDAEDVRELTAALAKLPPANLTGEMLSVQSITGASLCACGHTHARHVPPPRSSPGCVLCSCKEFSP